VLQKMSLEAMMRAEREEHNASHGDMSNGYRPRRTSSYHTSRPFRASINVEFEYT